MNTFKSAGLISVIWSLYYIKKEKTTLNMQISGYIDIKYTNLERERERERNIYNIPVLLIYL